MTGRTLRFIAVLLLLMGWAGVFCVRPANSQGIDFGDYIPENDENYALVLTPVAGYDELDFGTVLSGQGLVEIDLNSDDAAVIAIEGVRYLDVFVALDPPTHLWLDGVQTTDEDKQIPFTLQGGYANQGEGNTGPGFRQPFSGTSARFPIFRRGSGPPGPPPTPPHSGYVPPRETAYLFLYGNINVPTSLQAGNYAADILITVEYDI